MSRNFRIGDRVKTSYELDNNPHNNRVGTVTWLNKYFVWKSDDWYDNIEKIEGCVSYDDGTTEHIKDMYRKENRVVRVPQNNIKE